MLFNLGERGDKETKRNRHKTYKNEKRKEKKEEWTESEANIKCYVFRQQEGRMMGEGSTPPPFYKVWQLYLQT